MSDVTGFHCQGSHKPFTHFQSLGGKESVTLWGSAVRVSTNLSLILSPWEKKNQVTLWGSTFRVPTNLTLTMYSNTPQPAYTDSV